jgi:catalase-peroxidase
MRRRNRPTWNVRSARARRGRFPQLRGRGTRGAAEHLLIERAFRLPVSAPEMTVAHRAAALPSTRTRRQANVAELTKEPGRLTNDFYVNLLDMDTGVGARRRERESSSPGSAPRSAKGGCQGGQASRVDLVFGSNSELAGPRGGLRVRRCEGEVRARLRGGVDKVMNLDRFDVSSSDVRVEWSRLN